MRPYHQPYPHSLSIQEVLTALGTSPDGLSVAVAEKRLAEAGPNELAAPERGSHFQLLFKQFKSWMVIILVIAAVISALAGELVDTYVILTVVLVSAVIGFLQEYRAEKAIAALRKQTVSATKVVREGKLDNVPVAALVPGDILALEEGDYIPADARIIEAKNLRTIESSLTGESLPVTKNPATVERDTPLADRGNMLWKGTFVAGGYARAVVVATGRHTAIGDVSAMLGHIRSKRSHFLGKTDVLARQMAMIAFGMSAVLFLVGYFVRGFALGDLVFIFIAALVAAVPEDLAAVVSVVLAIGARRMTRRNALVRDFTATETLGAITAILTDKTGTLTQNTLVVCKVLLPGDTEITVSGEGWFPAGNFIRDKVVMETENNKRLQKLFAIAALSNNSEIDHNPVSDAYELIGDPTEGALNVLARKGGFSGSYKKLDDLPFDSGLKLRATLVEQNSERELLVVGAPEKLLEKSAFLSTPAGTVKLTPELAADIRHHINEWSAQAHRVIGLAYKSQASHAINAEAINELVFAGLTGMIDPPRQEAREAVLKCRQAGIRVIMVTGDHVNTAQAIARATGILEETSGFHTAALTEAQLSELDENEFDEAVMKTSVFARLSPGMKLRIAERLQAQGHLIAMTGDGVNDAPALKQADVGVSMGIMGTDVARYASDVVLMDDNFSTIVSAVEQGRIVFNNARQTSFFLITTNIAESATLLISIILGFPMPLTAAQILWLNLVTDGVTDMALGTEQGHGDIMQNPPKDRHENILNRSIMPFLIINVSVMTFLAITAFMYYREQSLEIARTAVFIVMAFTQLFNVYNLRSLSLSLFTIRPFSNKYINMAVGASVVLLVLVTEVPWFAGIFRFEALGTEDFLLWFLLSSMVLWCGELYKLAARKKQHAAGLPAVFKTNH